VNLSHIFQIIKEHGFKYSEFPIIVGIEDHTTNKGKYSVIKIIEKVLGN